MNWTSLIERYAADLLREVNGGQFQDLYHQTASVLMVFLLEASHGVLQHWRLNVGIVRKEIDAGGSKATSRVRRRPMIAMAYRGSTAKHQQKFLQRATASGSEFSLRIACPLFQGFIVVFQCWQSYRRREFRVRAPKAHCMVGVLGCGGPDRSCPF